MKQPAFVIKKGSEYWSRGQKWTDDLQEAIAYFKQENATRKGPGEGKVISVTLVTIIQEGK